MCLTSCNTFQKHLLSQKENLILWPKKWIFEISEAVFDSFWHPSMRKWHCKATLKVSKKILRPSIKNRLDTFVPNVPRINLIPFSWSYDQNWLRETLKTEKKAKTPPRWAFWNNRLHLLTKNLESVVWPIKCAHLKYHVNTMSTSLEILFFIPVAHKPNLENLTFKCYFRKSWPY